jgi:hypothetical protein
MPYKPINVPSCKTFLKLDKEIIGKKISNIEAGGDYVCFYFTDDTVLVLKADTDHYDDETSCFIATYNTSSAYNPNETDVNFCRNLNLISKDDAAKLLKQAKEKYEKELKDSCYREYIRYKKMFEGLPGDYTLLQLEDRHLLVLKSTFGIKGDGTRPDPEKCLLYTNIKDDSTIHELVVAGYLVPRKLKDLGVVAYSPTILAYDAVGLECPFTLSK